MTFQITIYCRFIIHKASEPLILFILVQCTRVPPLLVKHSYVLPGMPGALEYDEEDGLFDDGDDFEILAINPAVPISGPSRTRTIGSTRPDVTSLSVGDTGGNAIAGPSRPRARPQSIPQPALTGGRSTSTSGTAAYPALPPTAPRQNNHGPIVDTDYIIALQRRRLHTPEPAPDVGVPSLRNRCLAGECGRPAQ